LDYESIELKSTSVFHHFDIILVELNDVLCRHILLLNNYMTYDNAI